MVIRYCKINDDGNTVMYEYMNGENYAEKASVSFTRKTGETHSIKRLSSDTEIQDAWKCEVQLIKDLNAMRESIGVEPLAEDEWPTPDPAEKTFWIESTVILAILDRYDDGRFPDDGIVEM